MINAVKLACGGLALGAVLGIALPFSMAQQGHNPVPDDAEIPSTFTSAGHDSTWANLVGEWVNGSVRLALLPRAPGPMGPSLYGAIPDGPLEGVLLLTGAPNGANASLNGTLIRADATLRRSPASVTRTAGGLRLEIGGGPTLDLRRSRDVNRDRLARVAIIAHRGLSLNTSSLMNSLRAIEHAWLFGASGVELDVTVPYEDRRGRKVPLPRDLRIHHPPVLRAELTGFDSQRAAALEGALTPRAALAAATRHHLRFVYFDPKFRWLLQDHGGSLDIAVDDLATAAVEAVRNDARLRIVIGAETGRAAKVLASRSSTSANARLGWAHELTRGTDVAALLARAESVQGAPSAVSLNLLRIRGGGGGILGWLLRDVDASVETRLRRLRQPVIVWTAATSRQFEGALGALDRLSAIGPRRSAGIITPFPHRLAWYLATAPKPAQTR